MEDAGSKIQLSWLRGSSILIVVLAAQMSCLSSLVTQCEQHPGPLLARGE